MFVASTDREQGLISGSFKGYSKGIRIRVALYVICLKRVLPPRRVRVSFRPAVTLKTPKYHTS